MADAISADAKAVELVSPLPIQECCLRLQAAMDEPFAPSGSRPVIGRISGSRLFARKRIWYRNSFQTRLSADLLDQAGRTIIRCRFSWHPFVTAILILWLAGVVLIGGPIWVTSLPALTTAPTQAPAEAWMGILLPIGLLVSGFGLVWFGSYLARNERRFLIAFVRGTLAAIPR